MEERGRAERGTVAEHLVRVLALLEQAGGLGLLVGGRLGVPASALVSDNAMSRVTKAAPKLFPRRRTCRGGTARLSYGMRP